MLQYIELFGRTVPMYGLSGSFGCLLGLLYIALRSKKLGIDREDAIYIYVFGVVGALVGAKFLYLMTVFPEFMKDIHMLFEDPESFFAVYVSGGMVFFGGLIGAAISSWLTARGYHKKLSDFFPVLLPACALLCAFGRIGCLFAGCCYGIPTNLPIGIVFPEGGIAMPGVPLVPTQIIECIFDLMLFILMAWFTEDKKRNIYSMWVYILLYSLMRFFLEFFRGDVVRGFLWGLSTSQWISMILATVSLICIFNTSTHRQFR